MTKRLFFSFIAPVILMTVFPGAAFSQGWSFTASYTQTGSCIPVVPSPYSGMLFATRAACESMRQSVIDNVGDWSFLGDGTCLTVVTCTPCTGSDIGGSPGGSTSSGGPGTVSIDGLLAGKAFFSPHSSKDVENWIYDFLLRMNSKGINVDGVTLVTPGDVPLTGNTEFDRFYTEQMIRFEKPEQGGTVYLNDGIKGVVDPADLKGNTLPEPGTVTFREPPDPLKQYGQRYADKAGLFADIDNGIIDSDTDLDPYIDFARSAAVFGVGLLKKGAIPAIVIVDIVAEDIKQGSQLFQNAFMGQNEPIPGTGEIIFNTLENIATDVAGAYVGDMGGKAVKALTATHIEGVLVRKGVLPGIAKISDRTRNISEAVGTELGVLTGGADLADEWGKLQQKISKP